MKKFLMIFAFGIIAGNIGFAQSKKTTTTAGSAEPTEMKEHSGLKIGWIISSDLLASLPEKTKAM